MPNLRHRRVRSRTFMANSWNLSMSCCTRWILKEIFISSLFNFRLSSLAHPSGGPERLSTTLLLKSPSLRAGLVNGDARQELDAARTARILLKETMMKCAGGEEWRRLGKSHEVRGFIIYVQVVEISESDNCTGTRTCCTYCTCR